MAGPSKVPNLFDAWKQGTQNVYKQEDKLIPARGSEGGRERHKIGRQGTLEEVMGDAMSDPITKFGKDNRHYSSTAEMLRNAVLSNDPKILEAARKKYAELSPAERETVDTLIVNAMPHPRGEAGLSEGAREVLGVLNGAPLSPERIRVLDEVSRHEGFSWDRMRENAPLTREAPPDKYPETTDGVRGERPKNLSKFVAGEKDNRSKFTPPQPEITVAENYRAPAPDLALRQELGKDFDAFREKQRQALFDLLQATTAGRSGKSRTIEGADGGSIRVPRSSQGPSFPSNKDIARRLRKIFPDYNEDYIREWADEWTIALNKNDINALNETVNRRFPQLSPEQRDAEIDRLWQEAHEIVNYGRRVSPDRDEWKLPYDVSQRLSLADKKARGEMLTPEEEKILRRGPKEDRNTSITRVDALEKSDHEQFVDNIHRVLGYRPGFSASEFQGGRSFGRPSKQPGNINTSFGRPVDESSSLADDVAGSDSGVNAAEEFDPESVAQAGVDRAYEESGRRKPQKSRSSKGAPRSENLSREAVDYLYSKLVIDLRDGENVAGKRPPASYGFKTPEEMARHVVNVANKGGEPVIPPSVIESTVQDLANAFEQRWGPDLGASSLESKKPTADNAITESSNESRVDTYRDRLNAARAGKPLPSRASRPPAQASEPKPPYGPAPSEGTSRRPEDIPYRIEYNEDGGKSVWPSVAGEPHSTQISAEEYLAAKEAAERQIRNPNYLSPDVPVANVPASPRSSFDPRPVKEPSGENFDPVERDARLEAEAADAPDDFFDSSNPFLNRAAGGTPPKATPESVRPTPTQVGNPDPEVVTTGSPDVDEANRLLDEAATAPPDSPPPTEPPASAGADGSSILTPEMANELARMIKAIREGSGQTFQGGANFYEKIKAEREALAKTNPGAIEAFDREIFDPLNEAVAARRAADDATTPPTSTPAPQAAAPAGDAEAVRKQAYDAAIQAGHGEKVARARAEFARQKFLATQQAGGTPSATPSPAPTPTPATPAPTTGSRPESLDPLESAPRTEIPAEEGVAPATAEEAATPTVRPPRRTAAETMAADVARENLERGRAAGMIDGSFTEPAVPASPKEMDALRRRQRAATVAKENELLRGEAAAAVPPRASGTPGTPPESAKPAEAATSTEAAASKVDAAEAPRDAEADKAAATATTAAAQTDAAAAAARTADATNANTAPQTPAAGKSSSESRIRKMASGTLNAVLNPGATAMNAAGAVVGGGLGWAKRNALGLTALGGGIYAANATKDQWMPIAAPYIPDELEQPISDMLQTGSDAVGAAGRAVRNMIPRGGPGGGAAADLGGPQVQPVSDVGGAQIDEPGLPGPVGVAVPGGRPVMVDDPSVSRIRRMINANRPENQYAPQTPMRATTYYY